MKRMLGIVALGTLLVALAGGIGVQEHREMLSLRPIQLQEHREMLSLQLFEHREMLSEHREMLS